MVKSLAVVVLLVALTCFKGVAQPGIKDSIFSTVLKEERRLQIQLPVEYKPGSGAKYQVLYLLDGEWNAELFQQVQAWSRQWGFTPPVIMVGVVNSNVNGQNQRFRDLTPTSGGQDGAGGGPKLLSFLKDELIPYVNKTYPSSGSNILWGHSLGGLFVLYTLFTEPQVFDAYIAADPSVWWDNKWLIGYAGKRMGGIREIKSLFITGRTGGAFHEMGIDSLEWLLQHTAPPLLQWKAVAYPDETHVSQQYKSAYDGLKYTLAPLFQQDRIHVDPLGGMVVKGVPFTVFCYNAMAEKFLRFSTDGSEPTLASAKVGAENGVTAGGVTASGVTAGSDVSVVMRSFFSGDSANKRLAMNFKVGKWVAAAAKPVAALSGGWNYSWHRIGAGGGGSASGSGSASVGADTAAAAAAAESKTGIFGERVDLNGLDTNDYACRVSGWLDVSVKGYYVFEMAGGPGAKLFIGVRELGDRPVMEIAAGADYNSYIIPLEKGAHAIRYEFVHRKGGPGFGFSYIRPGENGDVGIPAAAMWHLP